MWTREWVYNNIAVIKNIGTLNPQYLCIIYTLFLVIITHTHTRYRHEIIEMRLYIFTDL